MAIERFKIYGLINPSIPNEERRVLITDSAAPHRFTTFDEQFSLGSNDKSTLSFKIVANDFNEVNPILYLLQLESVILLELCDRKPDIKRDINEPLQGQLYKYKIKSKTPEIHQYNTVYSIEASDYASEVYSKEGQGLSIDKTATLQELAEEILAVTRKNTIYQKLNTNLIQEAPMTNLQDAALFIKNGEYISYAHTNLNRLRLSGDPDQSYFRKYLRTPEMISGQKYDLEFTLLNASFLPASGDEQALQNLDITVSQYEIGNQALIEKSSRVTKKFSSSDSRPLSVSDPRFIKLTFTLDSDTDIIFLHIVPQGAYGAGLFRIDLVNTRIRRNKDFLELEMNSKPQLFLRNLESFEADQLNYDYVTGFGETRRTLSIDNSNLYNGLIELAALFEMELRFDYLLNAIYFKSIKNMAYRGYKINPNTNLLNFSRRENSNEFLTILNIRGNDDITSVIPPIPVEWREYLTKCVNNNFSGERFFENYPASTYEKIAEDYILPQLNTSSVSDFYQRKSEILKFAAHMDKTPSFDGRIYDFSYFYETGLMKSKFFDDLQNLLYNDLRKLNIKINILSYKYYTIFSKYSEQQNQIIYYMTGINNEQKFQYQTEQKLFGADAPREYTQAWVGLKNQLDASRSQERDFIDNLEKIFGIGKYRDFNEGSFIFNLLSLFGGSKTQNGTLSKSNGIDMLIEKNLEAIGLKKIELKEINEKINEIETKLGSSITSFEKESYEVERAGLLQRRDSCFRFIGFAPTNPSWKGFQGTLNIEKEWLAKVKTEIESISSFSYISLYNTLFNKEDPTSYIEARESLLQVLYSVYEAFAIEGVYENNDAIDSYSLLDQALKSFIYFTKPTVEYGFSIIDLSAIDNHEFVSKIQIGEKILITEPIYYKSYQTNEETAYLVVTNINQTLREPDSISLQVTQDDETEKLVKSLLKGLNMVSRKPYIQASNLRQPLPQEFKTISNTIPGITTTLARDLNVEEGFVNTPLLFRDMYISRPSIPKPEQPRQLF